MNEAEYLMKNYGDRGGCYPSRPCMGSEAVYGKWGRVIGKIKQNELDCRDTAPLER